MNILDNRFTYVPADSTNIAKTLRAHGFTPPSEDEDKERHEAAVRCMKRMAEYYQNVTPLRRRT